MEPLSFKLPNQLPAISVNEEKKLKFSKKCSVLGVENAVTRLNSYQTVDQNDEQSLIRFFRMMARDPSWMKENSRSACSILQAVTVCYFKSPNSEIVDKISKYVGANVHSLAPYAPQDVRLTVEGGSASSSALLLSCRSFTFERMLKGSFQEACSLRRYYTASASDRVPSISAAELSLKSLKGFVEMISGNFAHSETKLGDSEKAELLSYVSKRTSLDVFYPHLKNIFWRSLDTGLATLLFSKMPENAHVINDLIAELPGAFELLNHHLPPYQESGFKTKLKGLAQAVVSGSEKSKALADQKKAAMEKIYAFLVVAPYIESLSSPSLQKLSSRELVWMLQQLPRKITKLDLSNCQVSMDVLKEVQTFEWLQELSLAKAKKIERMNQIGEKPYLKHLDLTDCENLGSVEFAPYSTLETLHLKGCSNIYVPIYLNGKHATNLKKVSFQRVTGLSVVFEKNKNLEMEVY